MLDRHPEDPDKVRRRLANPLARFAPEREDRWLKIHSEGDDGPVSLGVAEPFVREHEAPVRDDIKAKLRAYIGGCGGVASSNGDHTPTPPSWSTGDFARVVGRDSKDWSVRQAAQQLAGEGFIHRNGDGRWQQSGTLFDDQEDE